MKLASTSVALQNWPLVQRLQHVVDAVNDYLAPQTLDNAARKNRVLLLRALGDDLTCSVNALLDAASEGHVEVIKWAQEIKPFTPYMHGRVFLRAVSNGRVRLTREMVGGCDAEDIYSGLRTAVESANSVAVEIIGTHCDAMDCNRLLITASKQDNPVIAQTLLKRCTLAGVDAALEVAAREHRIDMTQLLSERASVDSIRKAFREAAVYGRVRIIGVLLPRCGREDIEDAFWEAGRHGHANVVDYLAQRTGLPITWYFVLLEGIVRGQSSIVTTLVKYDSAKAGIAIRIAISENQVAVAKALVTENGVRPRSNELMHAVQRRNTSMCSFLSSVCSSDDNGWALEQAASIGCLDIVRILIAKSEVYFVYIAYRAAVASRRTAVAAYLYPRFGDFSADDALLRAAEANHVEVARSLALECSAQALAQAVRLANDSGHEFLPNLEHAARKRKRNV